MRRHSASMSSTPVAGAMGMPTSRSGANDANSWIQSLYARTQAFWSSGSAPNICGCGARLGYSTCAWIMSTSMSARRAFGS